MSNARNSGATAPKNHPFVSATNALDALAAGLCPVPPKMDGSKAPIGRWKEFQHFPPTEAQIHDWYKKGDVTGYGLITGKVSGNLELFEFDDLAAYHEFKSAADASGLGDLVARIEAGYCEQTPKPGIHWLYRCDEIAGNTKLATRPKTPNEMRDARDKVQVLIETRGEGGFVIIAPSNGKTHPSGGCYSLMAGGFTSIATITPDERRDLFALARTFTKAPNGAVEKAEIENVRNHRTNAPVTRPGDDFNRKADWHELLEAQGWTFVFRQGERDYWRRPGKSQGVSACTNWEGKDYFYCWSSSVEFEAEKPIDKVGFHARTMFGGDFKATVKALADAGYGTPANDRKPSAKPKAQPEQGAAAKATAKLGYTPPAPLADLIYTDDKGKSKLVSHQQAAAILAEKAEFERIRFHPIHGDFYHYLDDGFFERRPAILSESAVYRAVRKYSDNFPFSTSYVSGVTKCLIWETVANFQPATGYIGFRNGVLRLSDRQLLPHDPSYCLTSVLPYDYVQDAPEPTAVIRWLNDAVGGKGKEDQVQLLRAWLNAVIVGRPDLQRFLELIGDGGSGKGTFIRLATALIGHQATHSTDLKNLEGNRFESAKLYSKKLTVITDAERYHGDVTMLKAMTGQDRIRFEEKHKQAGDSFVYDGMVLIAGNQHTESSDYSSGIQRRRITLRFDHVVPASERRDLDAEFAPLLPAVAAWALAMSHDEVTHYLRNTSSAVRSLRGVRLETLAATNPLAAWMLSNILFDDAAITKIGSKRRVVITTGQNDGDGKSESRVEYENADSWLYANFVTWCEEHGKNPIAHNMFSTTILDVARNMLGHTSVTKKVTATGAHIHGMRIRQDEELMRNYEEPMRNSGEKMRNYVVDNDELSKNEEVFKENTPFSSSPLTVESPTFNTGDDRATQAANHAGESEKNEESSPEFLIVPHAHHNQEVTKQSSSQVPHECLTEFLTSSSQPTVDPQPALNALQQLHDQQAANLAAAGITGVVRIRMSDWLKACGRHRAAAQAAIDQGLARVDNGGFVTEVVRIGDAS